MVGVSYFESLFFDTHLIFWRWYKTYLTYSTCWWANVSTCFVFQVDVKNTLRQYQYCPLVTAPRYPDREVMVLSRNLPFGWKIFDEPSYFISLLVISNCFSYINYNIKITNLLIRFMYSLHLSNADLGQL